MRFDNVLEQKEDYLNKEVILKAVDEPRTGAFGGQFAVATIEYEGKEHKIAMGSVLIKQFEEYKKAGYGLPAKAMITKVKGKRYFSFAYIEPL